MRTQFYHLTLPATALCLALAACSTAPPKTATSPAPVTAVLIPDQPAQAPQGTGESDANPASPTIAAAGAADPGAQGSLTAGQDTAQSQPPTGTASQSETPANPSAVTGPADYANLFDRIRAGFALPDADHKAVDRELEWYAGNPDYLDRAFSRADLYLYHIVSQLEARHMPLELALLPVVESAFEPYAYSHSAASGLWQFIPGTGSRYKLKQDWWYDGRRDVVESTRAALDYLQYLHDEFGDWLLAVAAYNCGEANVERAVRINTARGRPTDFWNLALPAETRAYVPKLLAMKRVVGTPEKFGLSFSIPNQPYFAQVDTGGQMDLRIAAQIAGVSNEDLYELNPAFHRWATDPSGDTSGHFTLLVPADAADAFRSNVAQLSDDQRAGLTHYTVRKGDSINSVAHRFHTTAQALRELNNLPAGAPVHGSELRVPADSITLPAKVLHAAALADSRGRHRGRRGRGRIVVRRGDTLYAIAHKHGVDVNALALENGLAPGSVLRTGQHLRLADTRTAGDEDEAGTGDAAGSADSARRITVRRGDTLYRIARRYHVSVAQLASWNRLDETELHAGQKLVIHTSSR